MRFAPDSNLPDMSSDDYREYIAGDGLPSEDVIAARVDAFREREKDMPMKPFFIGEATLNGIRFVVTGEYRKDDSGAEYVDYPIIQEEQESGELRPMGRLAREVNPRGFSGTLEQEVIIWALQNKGVIR